MIWVCVTMAASLPSPRVMRVCQTMVVRPRCSGVHSARAVSPTEMPRKKLVLLSIVAVMVPVRQIGDRGGAAEIVGERHHRAAVQDAVAVGQLLAHGELGLDPLGRPW